MNEPIEESYFKWLCAKVLAKNLPIYFDLMAIMHKTEFVWIISGDKNRADDGRELRLDFLRDSFLPKDLLWYDEPASVFEVLIAFAERAYFQTETSVNDWFWQFLTNLDLAEYREVSNSNRSIIDYILQTFIWRAYEPSGHGGLFPMHRPNNDQTKIEIWYQFCEYLEDQDLL